VIINNFNTNIHFLNPRDFSKKVLYIETEVVLDKLFQTLTRHCLFSRCSNKLIKIQHL